MRDETKRDEWLQRAVEAYDASTTYFDNNIRKQVEADIRQATNRHPTGSKYYSDAYKGRSKLFRPKTASAIRNNDAIAAAAFFSTQDAATVNPYNDAVEEQLAAAQGMQELVQYRLTKTIPWFLTCIGAYNDAQTTGIVLSKQFWEFDKETGVDRPVVSLLPIENVRFDPNADWTDPINSSPYLIVMIPMYIRDVMSKMRKNDPKTGEPVWRKLTKDEIAATRSSTFDSTRQVRDRSRTDAKDVSNSVTEFDVVWVYEVIMRIDGKEMIYYTLSNEHMLTKPKPLSEVYFHGIRPVVAGYAGVEPHRLYPTSLPGRTEGLQAEINQIANSRIDNVLFAMNKRYFVKRGQQVDLRSLQRNTPGSATLLNDPDKDVKVVDTNDVTGSAYQEQDRLNVDFDDMAGTFSQSSVQSNRNLNETVGGLELITDGSNRMAEYQLRTFAETWVEKVLHQLVLLETYYETDAEVLDLAGSRLQEKFGVNTITESMLQQKFSVNVKVGIGATNPHNQVERFAYGMRLLAELLGPQAMASLDVEEVTTELFGKLGYRDGKRFFNWPNDAKYTQLLNRVAELEAKVAQKTDPALVAAQVKKTEAEAVKTTVEAVNNAIQTGQAITMMPAIAPVADEVLAGAGYQDMGGEDPNLPSPGMQQAMPPVQEPPALQPAVEETAITVPNERDGVMP